MDSTHPIGEELLACRNRTRGEIGALMGLNFWGVTAFNTVVYAFIVAGIVSSFAKIPPPAMYHPGFCLTFLAAAVLIVAASNLTKPRKDKNAPFRNSRLRPDRATRDRRGAA